MRPHATGRGTLHSKDGIGPFFTFAGLERNGDVYLAGRDPNQPLAAPAVFADLSGFPPILLQVAGNELLLDDSVRLAARAREAEVDVITVIAAGSTSLACGTAAGPRRVGSPARCWIVGIR